MTVPPLWENLISDWPLNLRKHSTQFNIANIIWGGSSLLALQFGYLPLWFMPWAFGGALILLVLSTLASNLSQKTVVSVDPTKVDIIPKDTNA